MALSDEEGQLLKGIVREYLELLDADRRPDDPVIARLFPSASFDDPTLEADFRDLSADDLDQHKRRTANRVLDYLETGDLHPLTDEEQEAWLVLLNDLRLAMGVRLGVDEDTFNTIPNPNDPAQWPLSVLDYLTALQGSLIEALQV